MRPNSSHRFVVVLSLALSSVSCGHKPPQPGPSATNSWSSRLDGYPLDLAFDPGAPSTAYAYLQVDQSYQIEKSTDDCQHWTTIAKGPRAQSISVHTRDPSWLFATGGLPSDNGGSVYVTRDGGNTWIVANQGLPSANVRCVRASPTAPYGLYALTDGGHIFESAAASISWTETYADTLIGRSPEAMVVVKEGVDPSFYVVAWRDHWLRLLRSRGSGWHWALVGPGLPPGFQGLAVDPGTPPRVFLLADAQLYQLSGDESSWVWHSRIPVSVFLSGALAFQSSTGFLYTGCRFYDAGDINAVLRSTDSGYTWENGAYLH